MILLYLHQYFITPDQPGGTRSYEFSTRLLKKGIIVHVIRCSQEYKKHSKFCSTETTLVDGIFLHTINISYSNKMSFANRIFSFLAFSIVAAFVGLRIKADLIYATSTPLTIAIPAIFLSKVKRIPYIFEVRDLWPEMPIAVGALKNSFLIFIAKSLERMAYEHSSHVVALSQGMVDGVISLGTPREKVSNLPNACDLELFSRQHYISDSVRAKYAISTNKTIIGYAGTLGKLNGVGYLIEVARYLLYNERFQFHIFGDGAEKKSIVKLAKNYGLLDINVIFHDSVEKRRMPEVFTLFDISTVLFLPIEAMESNSSNKFCDSLAMGCCVAINYGGWHENLLVQHNAGIRLSQNPIVAASQLQSLTPDTLNSMKSNARHLAELQFSRDVIASELYELITMVMSND